MQYTIESREITSEHRRRSTTNARALQTTVEAEDAVEAIAEFLRGSDSELVSIVRPGGGAESIATVKNEDTVFLVRVYTD